jgi:uncharacterized protein YlzI (FlbEa/FlbD family)
MLSNDQKSRIRRELLGGAKNKLNLIRSSAIEGLSNFTDSEVISILKSIAKNDTYNLQNGKKYPIRENAQKVLDKLKAEGKIK